MIELLHPEIEVALGTFSQHMPVRCMAKPRKYIETPLKLKCTEIARAVWTRAPENTWKPGSRVFACRGETQYFWPILLEVNLYLKILRTPRERGGST